MGIDCFKGASQKGAKFRGKELPGICIVKEVKKVDARQVWCNHQGAAIDGSITPPVGVNTNVIKSIDSEEELHPLLKGNFLFLDTMFVGMVILIIFQDIALVPPSLME